MMPMLKVELKLTNSTLTEVFLWSRWVRVLQSAVMTISSVDMFAQYANWC